MTNNVNLRLIEVRKKAELSQTEFAKKIGVATRTYTRYETSERTPDLKALSVIQNEFNVNLNWLICGIGEMELIASDCLNSSPVLAFKAEERVNEIGMEIKRCVERAWSNISSKTQAESNSNKRIS